MKTNGGLRIFSDATAIITGGASGIGQALAQELASRGGEVVVADLQIVAARKVASKIRGFGGRATAMEVDVTDYAAVEHVVKQTVQRTGRLDYMFNNAGISIHGDACRYEIEDWNRIVDINLRGVVNGVQATYNLMMNQGFGHIVNTASMAGIFPSPGLVSYATTKHAVVGLSTSLRGEAAERGIRVSALCPGMVRSAILEAGGKYGKSLNEFTDEQKKINSKLIEGYKPMDSNVFAQKALDGVAKNKAYIVLPEFYKLFWLLNRLLPSFGITIGQQSYQHRKKKLGLA